MREFISKQRGDIAVVVKNLKTQEEIKINENVVFPAASTIKPAIMSALLDKVNRGVLRLGDTVELREDMKTPGDGVLKELSCGRSFSLEELMTWMIIVSDNTAANILIDLLGMDEINAFIGVLGLKCTKLQRRMMDFTAASEGRENLITAGDLAHMLELIYTGQNVNRYYSDIMLRVLKRQQVKGRLDLYLPEGLIIAHKAGDLELVEHDGGIVFTENGAYVICVLTKGTEANEAGREIIGTISRMVYEEYFRDC